MTNELTPYQLGSLSRTEARRISRDLSKVQGWGLVERARVNEQAEIQAERVSGIAYVGKRGLHEVAMLSQLEVQLSMLVPAAIPRLQGIGDMTALSIADVVSETARRVNGR